jgi:hypothetical protein
MGMSNARLLLGLACSFAIPQMLLAQTLPPSVIACAVEPDVLKRLACYDREVARYRPPAVATSAAPPAVPATPPTSAVPTASDGIPAPSGTATADFGMTAELKRKEGSASAQPPKPDKLTARVASVSNKPTGEAIYTLEGGQVWVEAELQQHLPLHTGEEVSIRRGVLGAFYLSAAEVRGQRVKRVR